MGFIEHFKDDTVKITWLDPKKQKPELNVRYLMREPNNEIFIGYCHDLENLLAIEDNVQTYSTKFISYAILPK